MYGQWTVPKAVLTHVVVCFSNRKLFMPLSYKLSTSTLGQEDIIDRGALGMLL